MKFMAHVSRVDNVFNDRNPVCSCVEMEILSELCAFIAWHLCVEFDTSP